MIINRSRIVKGSIAAFFLLFLPTTHADLMERFELENGTVSGTYAQIDESPFNGVAFYTDGDRVTASTSIASGVPGEFQIDVRGISDNEGAGGIGIYLGERRLGGAFFGPTPSVQSVSFRLEEAPASTELQFVLRSENNTKLDWYELHRVGDIPPPPPPPVLPDRGAYETGIYRNMFAEMGIPPEEVQARVEAIYDQLFHSNDREQEAIFIPVGNDMAYMWDTGNDDVRSEGMSYGMMMALQMDRQEDFDRLWNWAHTYSLNKSGEMKGFFAWEVSTDGQVRDRNPAPDGEVYFATALFFASHRWGDGQGIYNYSEQANQIINDMYGNGEFRWRNDGGGQEEMSLFQHDERQIIYTPAGPSENYFTDPSYHLPAFFDLWALWADNHNAFWAEVAETSRDFLKTTVHPQTGLSPDYAYFDGRPHGAFNHEKIHFQYDAWRTVGNAAMDFYLWRKDPWQTTYVNTLQDFFKSQGIGSYPSLWELDGSQPFNNNTDHSPGLVAMNAMASLAADQSVAFEFIEALWNTPVPTGRYRYYDGSLYMFAMLALSGNYRIYCPPGECDFNGIRPPNNVTPPSSSSSSSAESSSSSSSATESSASSSSEASSSSSVASSSSSAASSSAPSTGEPQAGGLGAGGLFLLLLIAASRKLRGQLN